MKQAKLLGIFIGIIFSLILSTSTIYALNTKIEPVDDSNNPISGGIDENTAKGKITFTDLPANTEFIFCGYWSGINACTHEVRLKSDGSGTTIVYVCGDKGGTVSGILGLKFDVDGQYRPNGDNVKDCDTGDFFHRHSYSYELNNKKDEAIYQGQFVVKSFYPKPIEINPKKPTPSDTLKITIPQDRRPYDGGHRSTYKLVLKRNDNAANPQAPNNLNTRGGSGSSTFGPLEKGEYTLTVRPDWDDGEDPFSAYKITIDPNGGSISNGGGGGSGSVNIQQGENLCNPKEVGSNVYVCKTALGNIDTDPVGLTQKILSIALGLAGGIALIFMVYGSIRILVSSGDPKKVGEGRDIIVAAISGLLFLILSVLILKFIGIAVLPTNPFG